MDPDHPSQVGTELVLQLAAQVGKVLLAREVSKLRVELGYQGRHPFVPSQRRRCRGAGSNCRHADFQSAALPLSYLGVHSNRSHGPPRVSSWQSADAPHVRRDRARSSRGGETLPGLLVHGVAQARQETEHSNGDQQSAYGNGEPGECPDQNSSVRHVNLLPTHRWQALQVLATTAGRAAPKAPHRVFEYSSRGASLCPGYR